VWAHGEKLHILNRFWGVTEEFLKAPCGTFTAIGKCRNLDQGRNSYVFGSSAMRQGNDYFFARKREKIFFGVFFRALARKIFFWVFFGVFLVFLGGVLVLLGCFSLFFAR